MKRILVIKLGALGDWVQATGAFAAIRKKFSGAHITLLTTGPFVEPAFKSGFFDAVEVDRRASFWTVPYVLDLRRKLTGYDAVFDLQTNTRTSAYYFLAGKPDWCGIASGCTWFHGNPERNFMHTLDRLKDQLLVAGIADVPVPDVRFMADSAHDLLVSHGVPLKKESLAAFVPGGAAHRPEKRWPVAHFIALSEALQTRGYRVLLLGGASERDVLDEISQATGALNLCGQTTLGQLVDVFCLSSLAVGNDTGPMHMAAASGLGRVVVLFGKGSNPALCAPRGKGVHVLRGETDIAALSPQAVLEALGELDD